MAISVYKLIRLAKDGDSFKKDLVAQTLRTSVKIDDEFVEEFNKKWKTSGQLYVKDSKLTKAREVAIANKEKKIEVKTTADNG